MSINILELAKSFVGQQLVGQIGEIIGEDESKTSSAIGSILPALIGGIANQSSTDQGLAGISELLDQQDDGILDNIGDLLGGDGRNNFMNSGNGLLGTLLGGGQAGVVNLLIRATGLGNTKVGSLLSILAPIVLGIINRQRKSRNLGIGGLGELLKGQKEHIADSLPEGFEDLVGIGKPNVSRPAPSGGSLFGKLLPLGLLLVAAFLLLKILPGIGGKKEAPEDDSIEINQTERLGGTTSNLEDGPLQDALEGNDQETIILESGPLSDSIEGPATVEGSGVELKLD